jgi:hypothetical protein
MRTGTAPSFLRPFGLLIAVLLALFAGFGPSALANDTPGNNGTVKIHEGNTEKEPGEVRNEPHVCTFHLHFYFADPEQSGTWEIQEWAPTGTKGTVVLDGTYDTHGDGEDRQPAAPDVYTLPDGHYKLFWDGDTDKHDKMKVFWVDCPAPENTPTPPQTPAPTPTPTGTEQPATSTPTPPVAPASPPASPTPTGSELPAGGAGSPSPTGGEEGIVGTPPAGTPLAGGEEGIVGTPMATPPATDTAPTATASEGWRAVVFGLAVLTTAAMLLLPSRKTLATRPARSRRNEDRNR